MNYPFSECFIALAYLAQHDGVSAINNLPGCWNRKFGLWEVWVNGGKDERLGGSAGTCRVPSFSALVEFNGWPAGLINPRGGILAAGEAANEDQFIADIEAITGRKVAP